jgi:hypothetical protein
MDSALWRRRNTLSLRVHTQQRLCLQRVDELSETVAVPASEFKIPELAVSVWCAKRFPGGTPGPVS